MRIPSELEYCHERLGARFNTALSNYDTQCRLDQLINRFLTDDMVVGKETLDVGCGLGFFSERLVHRGARVTAFDLGPTLVERASARASCRGVVGDALNLSKQFGPEGFDLVVSSECIEHTPSPTEALSQMCAVLKPGGWMAISTPNKIWQPVVKAATLLHLRSFDGLENFSTFGSIKKTLESCGVNVVQEVGLHLWPFQLPLHPLSAWCDSHLQVARRAMINICVLGQKRIR